MIFRQLFEPLSSTYTYLIGCEETGKAILIDPVITTYYPYSRRARTFEMLHDKRQRSHCPAATQQSVKLVNFV